MSVYEPTHVSTFAGIDGIGLGLERAGFTTIASVEIDKFCNRVRAKRRPDVAQFGDIRGFGADVLLAHRTGSDVLPGPGTADNEFVPAQRVDILSGGFPCQDLSVAGKRAGLSGARSGLFYEFVRVARELQPTWLLVENVPGLLSSNEGRDFGVVLRELGDAGYFVEWRVLDSRWFGVAQRRRRVFLVGHLGGPPPSPVLTEPEGSHGDLAASDEAREGAAGEAGVGFAKPLLAKRGRRHNTDETYIPESYRMTAFGQYADDDSASSMKRRDHKDATDLVVAHTLRASGFDASEDGTGRGTPLAIIAAPLTSGGHPNSSAPGRRKEDDENLVAYALGSHAGTADGDQTNRSHAAGGPVGLNVSEEMAYSLRSGRTQSVAASSVRRLTPTECERLQGFPDGWTCLCDTDVCTCPDGPRYAALGNAVTVNVAEWIGKRIAAVGSEQ